MDAVDIETKVAEGGAPRSLQPSHARPVTQKSGQTATHAVLFTPELLCNIIAQLPLAGIFATTGVCHFWRNAVAVDPQIQKALFLQPEAVRRGLFFLIDDCWRDEFLSKVKSRDAIKDVTNMNACHIIGKVDPYLARIRKTWFDMRGSITSASTIGVRFMLARSVVQQSCHLQFHPRTQATLMTLTTSTITEAMADRWTTTPLTLTTKIGMMTTGREIIELSLPATGQRMLLPRTSLRDDGCTG